jgi:hypothetical protein
MRLVQAPPKLLSLAEFAHVTAFVDAGLRREDVLKEGGILPADWEHTQETWLARMAQQAGQGRYALYARYTELLNTERKAAFSALRSKRSKLKGIMPVPPVQRMSPILASPGLLKPRGPSVGVAVRQAPTKQQTAPTTARLTLEQLATLRAELVLAPDTAGEIRERFGLSERTHEQEDAIWQGRFQKDKELFQRYVKLFQYFRSLLAPR